MAARAAVQVAAMELGLGEERDLTVTGGLTFNGGPLNNYVMHSIACMADMLRANPGTKGLITANGGNLYKHAHGIYSATPPARDFEWRNVQPQIDALPARERREADDDARHASAWRRAGARGRRRPWRRCGRDWRSWSTSRATSSRST